MNPPDGSAISDRLVRAIRKRLSEGKRIRRTLPGWGRLAIDRPLPFLCVYRRPVRRPDRGTYRMVTSEAAYLTCSADSRVLDGAARLVAAVAEDAKARFGGCLILEVWAGEPPEAPDPDPAESLRPGFRIFAPKENDHDGLTDRLQQALQGIGLDRKRAVVATTKGERRWPRGRRPILPAEEAQRLGCVIYGVEVAPVYRDPSTGAPYPRIIQALRRSFSVSLRKFFYEFAQSATAADPDHFHALGRRAVVQAVWKVDGLLAEVSRAFEFLLQLSPTNTRQAWSRFQRDGYDRVPPSRTAHFPLIPSC